jgi:hypothetical protein
VYVDPTLATADIDRWLDGTGDQPTRPGASDDESSRHPSSPREQPVDQGQPKLLRQRARTKHKGGRPEIYGEAKQQVFASLNALKAAHELAWLDGKRPNEIEALLRKAIEKLPGRTRLREWIKNWRAQQSDSPIADAVCR